MRELFSHELDQVSGGGVATDSSGIGAALGSAVGVSNATSAGASWAGRALAGTVGGMGGAGLGVAFGLGYELGTAINDRWGGQISETIWNFSERMASGGGGSSQYNRSNRFTPVVSEGTPAS